MRLGMIGLGKMGGNMTRRLLRAGHEVVGWDHDAAVVRGIAGEGMLPAADLADLVRQLGADGAPRIAWMMVPAGQPVDDTIEALTALLGAGDVIVDGGNSNYRDTLRRAERLAERSLHYMDAGTSGGIWGLDDGYCLMVGGAPDAVALVEPLFHALAQRDGYAHVGPVGSGHFTKMVHNGIEYGLMQAYAEGYEILARSDRFDLDLHQVARLWNHGSVVRSWLNELAERAFAGSPTLEEIDDWVADSGEGRWTVQEAVDLDVPAPVITLALLARLRSRQESSFGAKVVAALRHQFGGHDVRAAE